MSLSKSCDIPKGMLPKGAFLLLLTALASQAGATVGDPLWKFFASRSVIVVEPMQDLSGNGGMDVLVGAADDTLYLVEGRGPKAGNQLWEVPFNSTLSAAVALPDVNQDGWDDVVAGDEEGLIQGISGSTGKVLWKFFTFGTVISALAIPDANGDQVGDVVLGSENDTVYCLSGKSTGMGKPIWRFGLPKLRRGGGPDISALAAASGSFEAIPRHADITGVNSLAAVHKGKDLKCVATGTSVDTLYCLDAKTGGSQWKTGFNGDIWKVVAFPDQDGDGIEEVLAACGADMAYLLKGSTGEILWAYPVKMGATTVSSAPDLSGDGKADALVGDGSGRVHCVSGAARGRGVSAVWVYDFGDTSTILSICPLGDGDGNGKAEIAVGTSGNKAAILTGAGAKAWSIDLGGDAQVANAGDLDGNGTSDLVAGTRMGYAAAFSGGGKTSRLAPSGRSAAQSHSRNPGIPSLKVYRFADSQALRDAQGRRIPVRIAPLLP